jgi:serine phosphatase RsbU (regulator of sigma subunit)
LATTPGERTAGTADTASARLAFALRTGLIGTWHWDLVTGHIERDSSMDSLLGIEDRSATPSFEEYLERVHPDDQPDLGRALREAITARQPTLTTEHRIVRPDGEVRWLQARAHVTFAPDGSATDVVGVVCDVTERRKTERDRDVALAAQEEAVRRAGAVERRIALLGRAADLLDAPLDLDGALQQVAYLAIGVLADWCTVDLLTDGRIHDAAVAHRDPAMAARARQVKELHPQDVDEPTFRHIISSLEPLFVEEFDDRLIDETVPDPDYRRILREFHLSSFLVVPLVAGGKGIGIITLAGCHGRKINPDDVPLAVDLGRRAGSAVEKVRLYAQLHQTAQVLQRSLLPASLPDIPGVTLSAHYRSGTHGLEIGGDFYDVFRTGRDRWWVALGDVCGKGPAAAALTAAVRYTVRAIAPDCDDPAAVLQRLNTVLLDQVDEGQFTSMVLATFTSSPADSSPGARLPLTMSVASAGHPAPLLFSPGRPVAPLACSGTVVGLLPDIEIEATSVTLSPGETLLFYTDGATEARTRDGVQVAEDGLEELVVAHHDGPAADHAERIGRALVGLTDGTLRDDLALLTLQI